MIGACRVACGSEPTSTGEATHVTPTLAGLAYDDVEVTGDVVNGGLFPLAPVILTDQGKVRGQGIFNVNLDYGNGLSTFVQGDVRGGGVVQRPGLGSSDRPPRGTATRRIRRQELSVGGTYT
jgi:hypothetical protein